MDKAMKKTNEGFVSEPVKQDLRLAVLEDESIRLTLCNFGASVYALEYKYPDGHCQHIALGCDTPEAFSKNPYYYGATVGRVANRIKDAELPLDGKLFMLSRNEGKNQIHGGFRGLSGRIWDMEKSGDSVLFTVFSPDGDEGYPGNLKVSVRYTLNNDEILIEFMAASDSDTVFGPTNHTYWCLGGPGSKIDDEILCIAAGKCIEVDEEKIPTGRIMEAENTPFDFRKPVRIGDQMYADHPHLKANGGYDICYVLDPDLNGPAGSVEDPESGLRLEVESSFPGIQLYTGNSLDDRTGRGGIAFGPHSALCLECCAFPDTVHHDNFGSVLLKAGEVRRDHIRYRIQYNK